MNEHSTVIGIRENKDSKSNLDPHLLGVVEAIYLHDFKLVIKFDNGESRLVDLSHKMRNAKGIFLELKDPENFKNFQINPDTDTIEWENGADWSPETLYLMGTPI